MAASLLTNARFVDGSSGSVAISDGRVVDSVGHDVTEHDLGGRLLLPALCEPHAHLDKAFLADRFPNPTGDLLTAIEVMHEGWPAVTPDDIAERAERAARRLLLAGTTAIRTHADLWVDSGLKSVSALVEVRDRLAHLMDIGIVALAGPLTGPEGGAGRRLLDTSLAAGADVVGSCPHIEDDVSAAISHTLAAAAESGLPADLHFDEVLDVGTQNLEDLARQVDRRGLGGRVVASHCVSHGLLSPEDQRSVARALADAGVAVVVNPRTNLYLQGRGVEQAIPRGMLGLAAMCEQGVAVAAGADNVQDPFYVIGRSDPLETATLLVSAAHRTVEQAAHLVGVGARRVIGAPTVGHTPGDQADLVAIAAMSLREAVADQSADRLVFRRGVLVARTSVEEWTVDAGA